jgi:hypothetical protein
MIQCRLVKKERCTNRSLNKSYEVKQDRLPNFVTIDVIAKIFSFKNLWQSVYRDENAAKTILISKLCKFKLSFFTCLPNRQALTIPFFAIFTTTSFPSADFILKFGLAVTKTLTKQH